MSLVIEYRPLLHTEMSQVVDVHKKAFSKEQLKHTIFTSPHVAHYLSNLISFPDIQNEHKFIGALDGHKIIGYAHFRWLPDSLHLNQIAVLPEYQDLGIGRNLIEMWIEQARKRGQSYLTLHVDMANEKSLSLYSQFGLSVKETEYTFECRLVPRGKMESVQLRLLDWENSLAWQQIYGFSKIYIEFQEAKWEIGWIGEMLRIDSDFPAELFDSLLRLVPNATTVICKTKALDADLPATGTMWKMVGQTANMWASLEEIG